MMAAKETRLLRDLRVQQGMRELLALQELLEPQMRETAHLFAQACWAALAELQDRLRRLAEWQALHGQSVHVDPSSPETIG